MTKSCTTDDRLRYPGLKPPTSPSGQRPPLWPTVCSALLMVALVGCTSESSDRPQRDAGLLTYSPPEGGEPQGGGAQSLFRDEQTAATPVLTSPEIYRGSSDLFGTQETTDLPNVSAAGQVTLNFVDTDIREVIGAILGDALGLNYTIDPNVEGSVTIRTTRPLPPDAVLPLVEDLLAANRVALVPVDGVIRAMPMEKATARAPVKRGSLSASAGFGLHVFPCRFVSASALREVLEPFVPSERTLRVDDARNLLVFAGSSAEAAAMEDLVHLFDVDWLSNKSFALFPVKYTNPEILTSELAVVFGQEDGAPGGGLVNFFPIERMRAILAITPQPLYLSEVEAWVRRLDRGEESVEQRVYVYRVQNGRAIELAQVLSEVFGGGTTERGSGDEVAPGLRPATISSRAGSSPTGRRAAGLGGLDRDDTAGSEDEGPTSGAALAERLGTGLGGGTGATAARAAGAGSTSGQVVSFSLGGEQGDLRIVADERNNALVVMATPNQYRLVLAALEQLDVMPLQVLIEATVAEVTLNDELRYGVEWFFQEGNSTVSFSSLAGGAVASAFPGFSYLLSKQDVRVVINALSQMTNLKLISSPQVVVLDNGTARIQVGDEVPVATQTAVSVSNPDAPLVNTIQFRSTGVILEVTPRVNAGGLVTLELAQEVSRAVPTTTSSLDSPTIQQRLVETSVAVPSGEVIALGGLIQDANNHSTSGVPLLSDIPVVGNLFKTTRNVSDRTELLVLMSPRVIRNIKDAREITKELRRRMYALESLRGPDD